MKFVISVKTTPLALVLGTPHPKILQSKPSLKPSPANETPPPARKKESEKSPQKIIRYSILSVLFTTGTAQVVSRLLCARPLQSNHLSLFFQRKALIDPSEPNK